MIWLFLSICCYLVTTCSAIEKLILQPKPSNICNYNPSFNLGNIQYYSYLVYSTPSHLAVSQGFVNFTLLNSASISRTSCQGTSSTPFDFFRGERDYPCENSQTLDTTY